MTKTLLMLILLGSLLLTSCSINQGKSAPPTGWQSKASNWTVWIEDGKNGPKQFNLLRAKTPLDNYRENMALIHPWDFATPNDENDPTRTKLGTPQITYISQWGQYLVYDLTDHVNACKQIMLKDKTGNHKILYSQLPWSTASVDDLPYIVETHGTNILAYRTTVPGTGHFFIEYYFVYDKKSNKPVLIDTSAINNSLSHLLPEGHSVRKGGGFDVKNITFSHHVWKEDDANCCPTAGTVCLKVALENAKLIVVEEKYNPNQSAIVSYQQK